MPLQWELELGDGKFTPPADRASQAMQRFSQSITGARSASVTLGKDGSIAFKTVAEAAEEATVSIAKVGVAMLAIGAAIYKGIKALDDFGDKAIEAFGERQGAIRAYTTLLGDATKAQVEFAKAQQLSQKTDLTSKQVEGAQKALMVAGFRGQELDQALLATADVASMASPQDRQLTTDRVARALGQIFSKGKLQGEELMQLSEAGLSRKAILEDLASTGRYGKDASAVEKSISGGKVDSATGIAAIERAVLKQFGTQRLGQYALGASGSLTSMLSNRDEAMQNVLKAFDAEEHIPGVERYKKTLTEQAEAFDLASQRGQALSFTVQGLAQTSTEVKSTWTEFLTGFVASFAESYNAFLLTFGLGREEWQKTGDAAKQLGATLGSGLGESIAKLTSLLSKLSPVISLLDVALTGLIGTFRMVGSFIGNMIGAIVETVSHPARAAENFKRAMDATVEETLGINKPRVAAPEALPPGADPESGIVWVNGPLAQGQNQSKVPAMADGGVVTRPTLALVGEAGPEAVIPLDQAGGMMGGGVNVTMHISTGNADPQEVADVVWERFARELSRLGKVPRG